MGVTMNPDGSATVNLRGMPTCCSGCDKLGHDHLQVRWPMAWVEMCLDCIDPETDQVRDLTAEQVIALKLGS